jgi:phosphoribosylformylglycinamidine synthase
MALAGGLGAHIFWNPNPEDDAGRLFGEDQGRYVVTFADSDDCDAAIAMAARAGVEAWSIGIVAGQSLLFYRFNGDETVGVPVELSDLRRAHEGFFPALMGGEIAAA